MSLKMSKIIIHKTGKNTGTASVRLVDDGLALVLNRIMIDFNNGDSPVAVLRYDGVQIYSGEIVNDCLENIYDIFINGLESSDPGIYEVSKTGINKIK